MSTYVIVHGAWYAGWTWEKVIPLLEEAGHRAIAPDMPGMGADKTPLADITMDTYVDRVSKLIEAASEPVILLGHSMGGRVVTLVAERHPDKIKTLVYLAAVLLPDGEISIPDDPDIPDLALERSITTSADGSYRTLDERALGDLFYHDCPPEVLEKATELFRPDHASQPFTVPMRTTDENFGSIPRVYIECLQDKAMTLNQQRLMYAAMPCDRIISMDTGHSPFLAAPEELAGHLLSLG